MDFLSKIVGFFSSIPWVKVGIFTAVISGVVYSVHVIKLSGEQAQEIIQMKKDTQQQQKQDEASIQALKDQYARDTQAMQKEKDDAIQITKSTQQQIDKIASTHPSSDGTVRPVLAGTLDWMRGHNPSDNNPNTEDKPTTGVTDTNRNP